MTSSATVDVARTTFVKRPFIGRLTKFDAMLISILLGPLAVVQVAGKTPNLFWIDLVIGIFATLAFLKVSVRPSDLSFRVPAAVLWTIAYLVICTASMVLTQDLLLSIAILKLRIAGLLVFLLIFRLVRTRDDVDHFFLGITWFGSALAGLSLYNWYKFSSGVRVLTEEFGPKDMLQLSFGRSNYLASIFILLIPTMLAFTKSRTTRLSFPFYVTGLVLVSVALLFTQSRGSLISLAFGLGLWALLAFTRSFGVKRVLKGLGWLVFALVVAGLLWSRIPQDIKLGLGAGFGLLFSDAVGAHYGSGRVELWVAALKGAWDSNLFGIGLGNQALWFSWSQLPAPSAHSLYLETLLETGILGLIALLGIFYCFGKTVWRLWKISSVRDRPLAGAMVVTFITSLVNVAEEPSFWAPQYTAIFWMMMGLAYSWLRFLEREQGPSKQRPRENSDNSSA